MEFNDDTPWVEVVARVAVFKRMGTTGRGMIETGARFDDVTQVDSTRDDGDGAYLGIGTLRTVGDVEGLDAGAKRAFSGMADFR